MSNGSRGRRIPAPALARDQQPVRFSFKHLDLNHQKFGITECDASYLVALFARLHDLSTWTVDQFVDQNNKEHRHVIDFDQTSERVGFAGCPNIDPDQLGFHEAWQFGISPETPESRWRAHGILIDDTFFLVWLDPHHRLYPTSQ